LKTFLFFSLLLTKIFFFSIESNLKYQVKQVYLKTHLYALPFIVPLLFAPVSAAVLIQYHPTLTISRYSYFLTHITTMIGMLYVIYGLYRSYYLMVQHKCKLRNVSQHFLFLSILYLFFIIASILHCIFYKEVLLHAKPWAWMVLTGFQYLSFGISTTVLGSMTSTVQAYTL
jgi:hypothetical protein